MNRQRAFWVVSPNVRFNYKTERAWKDAAIRWHSAFMGWGSEERQHKALGWKFAHVIQPGDVILIARRHYLPDVVACGVVNGPFEGYRRSLGTPDTFGSRRKLRPFKVINRIPDRVPVISALNHVMALRKLLPDKNEDHRKVCKWLSQQLLIVDLNTSMSEEVQPLMRELHLSDELEFQIQSRKTATRGKREEGRLLIAYQRWLEKKGRSLHLAGPESASSIIACTVAGWSAKRL